MPDAVRAAPGGGRVLPSAPHGVRRGGDHALDVEEGKRRTTGGCTDFVRGRTACVRDADAERGAQAEGKAAKQGRKTVHRVTPEGKRIVSTASGY